MGSETKDENQSVISTVRFSRGLKRLLRKSDIETSPIPVIGLKISSIKSPIFMYKSRSG